MTFAAAVAGPEATRGYGCALKFGCDSRPQMFATTPVIAEPELGNRGLSAQVIDMPVKSAGGAQVATQPRGQPARPEGATGIARPALGQRDLTKRAAAEVDRLPKTKPEKVSPTA